MPQLRAPLAALTILCLSLPLFIDLGRTDLRNDEAIYSYAVDRVLETGRWLTPESSPNTRIPGDPTQRPPSGFFEKPPLKFWIVAAPIHLGLLPHDEWGLRFWDAAFGALAFAYVFLIGRRLVDPFCGALAVLFLVAHAPLLFVHGLRENLMESALLLAYCGGIHHFMAWTEEPAPAWRRLHALAVGGWFAFGFLTKFVAALFLPVVLGGSLLFAADWRRSAWRERWLWLQAAAVSLLFIAPWFVWQYAQVGDTLWEIMLGQHVLERFTGSLDPLHVQPWHSYATELWHMHNAAYTGVWVLAGSGLWLSQCVWRGWSGGVLILLWLALPVVLISFGSSKLYHYVYPFLPAAALMGAYPASLLIRLARGQPSGLTGPQSPAWRARIADAADLASSILERRFTRALLAVAAIASLASAGITLLSGPIVLEGPGGVRVTNSSALRACVVGLLCVVPLCPTRLRAVALLIALLLGPLARYVSALDAAVMTRRPMRVTRDCILEQSPEPEHGAPPTDRPGLFVHLPPGEALSHNYNYYYRQVGPWERSGYPDDALLRTRLFQPLQRKPTLILEEDYVAFRQRMESSGPTDPNDVPTPGSQRQPGAHGSASSLAVVAGIRLKAPRTTSALLLLPGPYEACVQRGIAAGAEPYRGSAAK